MTKFIVAVSLLFAGFSLAQDKVELVANAACSCLNDGDISLETYDDFVTQLGLCIAPTATENYEQLCKELHLDKKGDLEYNMEKIGEAVGLKLVSVCPRFLEIASELMRDPQFKEDLDRDKEGDVLPPPAELGTPPSTFTGQVTKIQKGELTYLLIESKDETLKFLWLERFDGSEEFEANPDQLIGKKVTVLYNNIFTYDGSSGLYAAKREIISVEVK